MTDKWWDQAPIANNEDWYSGAPLASQSAKPDSPRKFGIDFTKPVEEVRSGIAALPEDQRPDATRQWADSYVARERDAGRGIGQAATDTFRTVARGVPFVGGLLDEANATTQDWMHRQGIGGAPYDETLAYNRAYDRAIDKEMPGFSVAAQLTGGIGTPGALIGPAQTVLGNIARGVPLGAAYGYGSGYANAEGGEGELSDQMAKRHESGVKGAGIGAVVGPVIPLATAAAQRAAGIVGDALAPRWAQFRQGTPDAAADKIIARKIEGSGQTPESIAADLEAGRRSAELGQGSHANLPEVIGDTTDSLRRLSGTIYRQGGKGAEEIKEGLDRRQRGPDNPYAPRDADGPQGQIERVVDDVERALQIKSSSSARRTEADMLAAQKAEGDSLYTKARDNSEEFDLDGPITAMSLKSQDYPAPFQSKIQEAINLFTRPVNPRAADREKVIYERMMRLQEDEQRKLSRARSDAHADRIAEDYAVKQERLMRDLTRLQYQDGVTAAQRRPVNDVNRFDASKKALDDMIETAEGNLKRVLVEFKHSLLARVHEPDAKGLPTKNADYQAARDAWGSRAENREAIDLGRAALRENSEVSAEQFRALTKGQQKLFRIGFRESLYNRLSDFKPGDDITALFQKRRIQDLMREIIPTPAKSDAVFADRPERFGDVLRRESRMVQHRNEALGNSKTQQRQSDDAEYGANVLGEMWSKFRGSPTLVNMGFEAVASVLQRVTAYRQDVAEAMAKRIMQADPAEQIKYLNGLRDQLGASKFEELLRGIDEAASRLTKSVSTTGGQASARNENAKKQQPSESRLLSQARNALSRGAPRGEVEARLRSMGVDPRKI